MPRNHRFALLLFSAWLAAAPAFGVPGQSLEESGWQREPVAPGVELYQRHFPDLFGAPQAVHILRVNLDEPRVKVRFAATRLFGQESSPLPELAEMGGALGAINGGFAHGGPDSSNSGILKIDGELLPFLREEPEELRFVAGAALGIDEEGQWHFVNRPGHSWPEDLPELRHALAGGHRLIEAGDVHFSVLQFESARERRHAGNRHPRTAIGLQPDRVAMLVAVDGRHAGKAEGVTLEELANFLKALGCVEALNLDGGGSTTLWLRGKGVLNHPSDNRTFDHQGARGIRSAVVVLPGD